LSVPGRISCSLRARSTSLPRRRLSLRTRRGPAAGRVGGRIGSSRRGLALRVVCPDGEGDPRSDLRPGAAGRALVYEYEVLGYAADDRVAELDPVEQHLDRETVPARPERRLGHAQLLLRIERNLDGQVLVARRQDAFDAGPLLNHRCLSAIGP